MDKEKKPCLRTARRILRKFNMYIHIGNNKVVRDTDILGIFDLDSATVSVNTRNYLSNAQREKRVITLGYELPKSFIILKNKEVYLSPFNTSSIIKNQ